ncbi:MAG: UDP-N-acetylglucosamine 2-epimerase (non-hydrolyzing) [Bacteroidales bacterium]|nr:UDP-N-acetylglucosamine 2-epimerase (non-hydrolyzing) [Bacteroidales bacterium]
MKIVTIIGARPQIIKAAGLSRIIHEHYADRIREVIVHTGQHYDENMSQVFINELGIPQPDYNLHVGSASHGIQTARMIEGIERILLDEKPDYIVLYGDTNSTLAGAVAASKIQVPIVHIEAGLRSFNKSMPEEINRIVCDHCSTLLFTPTLAGFENLAREGFKTDNDGPYNIDNPKVFHCGDIMYDNSLYFSTVADQKVDVLKRLDLEGKPFVLTTLHRNNNTDDKLRLNSIVEAVMELSKETVVVLPLHPRTRKMINQLLDEDKVVRLFHTDNIIITDPVSFLEMIQLEKHASLVMTDSGGVQKESYFFKKPCVILRPETEWVEIVKTGAATLVDADQDKILQTCRHYLQQPPVNFPEVFGDGHAAEFMLEQMTQCHNDKTPD